MQTDRRQTGSPAMCIKGVVQRERPNTVTRVSQDLNSEQFGVVVHRLVPWTTAATQAAAEGRLMYISTYLHDPLCGDLILGPPGCGSTHTLEASDSARFFFCLCTRGWLCHVYHAIPCFQQVNWMKEAMGLQSSRIPQFPEYDARGRQLKVQKCTFNRGQKMDLHV